MTLFALFYVAVVGTSAGEIAEFTVRAFDWFTDLVRQPHVEGHIAPTLEAKLAVLTLKL